MKQLLIYTGPNKKFDYETSILVKIQIDNCLDLGWKKDDLLIATDFPYSYQGINSLVVPDNLYYKFDMTSNKILAISYLIAQQALPSNELIWYHDFDVYQVEKIKQEEIELGDQDIGIVPYGYKPEWNLGSIFFNSQALDIFELIHDNILHKRKSDNRCDEKALKRLIVQGKIRSSRYKEFNVAYNFTKRCIQTNYKAATKPIKVIHFHPWDYDEMMPDTALNIFMYGKNRIKTPLMSKRLIKIFYNHGIN